MPHCSHAQPRIEQRCPPRAAHPAAQFSPSSLSTNQEDVIFPKKKSKPTQNRNWILKRYLKDLLLNFKDPFVLKIVLHL
jgi:hypothetical protein